MQGQLLNPMKSVSAQFWFLLFGCVLCQFWHVLMMIQLDAFGCLPYRQGVPLSAFGLLGYLAVAGLALVPLKLDDESVDKSTRSLLLVSVQEL